MTLVLKLLRRISARLGVPVEHGEEVRAEQLAEETNVDELVETLRDELTDHDGE